MSPKLQEILATLSRWFEDARPRVHLADLLAAVPDPEAAREQRDAQLRETLGVPGVTYLFLCEEPPHLITRSRPAAAIVAADGTRFEYIGHTGVPWAS